MSPFWTKETPCPFWVYLEKMPLQRDWLIIMLNGVDTISAISFTTFDDRWSQPALYLGLRPWMIFSISDGFVYWKWNDDLPGDDIYIYIYVEGCFIRNINFTGKTRPYFSEVLIEFISDIFSTTHIFPIIQKVSWKFDFWFLFIHNIFKSVPPFPDISFSKPMGIMLYFRSPNTLSEIAVVYL